MEALMRAAAPQMEPILSMVDVSFGDKHLVVHFKPAFNRLSPQERVTVENAVANLWRSTRYVRELNWSPDVEFHGYRDLDELKHDDTDSWSYFNRGEDPQSDRAKPERTTTKPTLHQETLRKIQERDRLQAKTRAKLEEQQAEEAGKHAEREAEAKLKNDLDVKERRAATLLKMAKKLEVTGKIPGAIGLYRQITKEFPETKSADHARQRNKALDKNRD